MKLYLITPDTDSGLFKGDYDTYESAVVAAVSLEAARETHPTGDNIEGIWGSSTWVNSPNEVVVEYLGRAKNGTKAGVILASFNAG